MSFLLDQNNSLLFDDSFNIIKNKNVYKLENWYQLQNNSTTTLSHVHGYDDFNLTRSVGLRIGADADSTSNNNKAFFVAKKYFKFDPTKTYAITIRVRCNSADIIKVGFIGLTSRPTRLRENVNVYDDPNDNDYFDEIFNLHRYVYGHNGVVGDPQFARLEDSTVIEHYAPINKTGINDNVYRTFTGYIKGTTASALTYTTSLGLTTTDPVPMRTICDYVTPFFAVHNTSVSLDSKEVVIDYLTVHDTPQLDYGTTTISFRTETVDNIGFYDSTTTQYYVTDDGTNTGIDKYVTSDGTDIGLRNYV